MAGPNNDNDIELGPVNQPPLPRDEDEEENFDIPDIFRMNSISDRIFNTLRTTGQAIANKARRVQQQLVDTVDTIQRPRRAAPQQNAPEGEEPFNLPADPEDEEIQNLVVRQEEIIPPENQGLNQEEEEEEENPVRPAAPAAPANDDHQVLKVDDSGWKDVGKQVWKNFKNFNSMLLRKGKLFARIAYTAIQIFTIFEPALSFAAEAAWAKYGMNAEERKTLNEEIAAHFKSLGPDAQAEFLELLNLTDANVAKILKERHGIDSEDPEYRTKLDAFRANDPDNELWNSIYKEAATEAKFQQVFEKNLEAALQAERIATPARPPEERLFNADGQLQNNAATRELLKKTANDIGIDQSLTGELTEHYSESFVNAYNAKLDGRGAAQLANREDVLKDLKRIPALMREEGLKGDLTKVQSPINGLHQFLAPQGGDNIIEEGPRAPTDEALRSTLNQLDSLRLDSPEMEADLKRHVTDMRRQLGNNPSEEICQQVLQQLNDLQLTLKVENDLRRDFTQIQDPINALNNLDEALHTDVEALKLTLNRLELDSLPRLTSREMQADLKQEITDMRAILNNANLTQEQREEVLEKLNGLQEKLKLSEINRRQDPEQDNLSGLKQQLQALEAGDLSPAHARETIENLRQIIDDPNLRISDAERQKGHRLLDRAEHKLETKEKEILRAPAAAGSGGFLKAYDDAHGNNGNIFNCDLKNDPAARAAMQGLLRDPDINLNRKTGLDLNTQEPPAAPNSNIPPRAAP